ncbi:hypothetical protein [Chryseobacterium taihuense]|uniref:Lipoprotein n=1 Tax=Chryseobacterium taihuense TaxID=1141221 RepID=A0ABY0QRL7_9FLAO|nr:hypothetical protein [Chryseobacterium taihuense]SDL64787.1 hypothetical protein SAMN05216273_10418 [Chryseobacterium taihuense]
MSAVKIKGLKIFFSMFLLLIFFSCENKNTPKHNTKERIESISISHIGGRNGFYEIIKIRRDSLFFESGTSKPAKNTSWKNAVNIPSWDALASSFKLKNLDSIRSSPSIQHLDGIDETFIIKTNKKSHIYVNAYHDVHYYQFENFKQKLEKILSQKQPATIKTPQP